MFESPVTEQDIVLITQNLGRRPAGVIAVAKRCPAGHPLVIRVANIVSQSPFPTMFWLVCKQVTKQIDRIEASGAIKRIEVDDCPDLAAAIMQDHASYVTRRKATMTQQETAFFISKDVLNAGVGGLRDHRRVRCLHMFFALHYATGESRLINYLGLDKQVALCGSCS